ncbi:MAG: DUF1275 domain-containing protein [Actinobacteria bacterium]|nr:DUF1275 domain-containing protein [Actinomycetota bacterium]
MNTRPREQIKTLIAIALTFGSGAMDVTAFTRLGNVFASVMTGNIVLSGLALARGSAVLLSHTLVAMASYVAGVAGGTWIAHGFKAGEPRRHSGDRVLPPHVGRTLLAQLTLLAVFAAGWEASGARPAGAAEFCLLALAAAAMGTQSTAVLDMSLTHVSTTYLTGTLTQLVSSLARPGQDTSQALRRFGVLFALLCGAALGALLVTTAAAAVPAVPLAALLTTLVLTTVPVRDEVSPGRPPR